MKTLLLILLFAPLFGLSQKNYDWDEPFVSVGGNQPLHNSIFYFWEQYLNDCNELTPDTIKQTGVVNVNYKPVMFEGKISHYLLAPIDTVWEKVECKKYKETDGTYFFTTLSSALADGNWIYTNTNRGTISYSKSEQVNNKINITRNKICMIKKQKANWQDFWDGWCKEKGIVEFN